MKSIFYLFLLFSCLKVNAQTGIHDPNLASIDTKVKSFMATYTIPGLTFALAKNGKIVYMRAFGTSVLGQTVLAQPHNLYRIASLSKPITSIAIMKLVQEGKVS